MLNQERILTILKSQHISEKATFLSDCKNTYIFKVSIASNKYEIKQSLKNLFHVDVKNINTLKIKGKEKKTNNIVGKRSMYKKAYITLYKGQKIDISQDIIPIKKKGLEARYKLKKEGSNGNS